MVNTLKWLNCEDPIEEEMVCVTGKGEKKKKRVAKYTRRKIIKCVLKVNAVFNLQNNQLKEQSLKHMHS